MSAPPTNRLASRQESHEAREIWIVSFEGRVFVWKGGGLWKGSSAVEGIYSGCMGCIHLLWLPPKFLMEFHHSSILQPQVELFVLIVGIFVLWDFDDNKNKATMARAMPLFCTSYITKNVFTMLHLSPTLRFFPQQPHIPHIMNFKNLYFMYFKFLTPTGIKVYWPWCNKIFLTSFKYYNLKIYPAKRNWSFFYIFPY
jgi:hypothetical protein